MEEEPKMELGQLGWLTRTERRIDILLTLCWGTLIVSIYSQAMYQNAYPTLSDQLVVFAVCLTAGAIMNDFEKALLGYVATMSLSMIALFILAVVPASLGALPPPGDLVMQQLWISIIFKSVFPFPIFGFLIATMLGAGLGEKFL